MSDRILVDNDIILKVVLWHLQEQVFTLLEVDGSPPSILGVAQYVIRGRLRRVTGPERAEASEALERVLARVRAIEPNDDEVSKAAEFEAAAISGGLELDGGESQLLAILLSRQSRLLVTGDKRGICAMAVIAPSEALGRIACLEQLVSHLVRLHGAPHIRHMICRDTSADKAVAICFSCARDAAPSEEEVRQGLASYVNDLNEAAPRALIAGFDLSEAIPS